MTAVVNAVVFDLGGVLLDWDPRYLYRTLIKDPVAMEEFLASVCNESWNLEMDRGLRRDEAVRTLTQRHPDKAALIAAYKDRWLEMIRGANEDVVAILRRLKEKSVPLYSITNFNDEALRLAQDRYPFLTWFDGMIVSAVEKMVKPDPAIYRLLLERYNLRAENLYFTDDRQENVVAAKALGFHASVFQSAAQLQEDLRSSGLDI